MRLTTHFAGAAALLMTSATAMAHEGHGLVQGHWHASDTYGSLLVVLLAALALLVSRGK